MQKRAVWGCTTAGCPVGQLAASGGRVHGAGSNASVPVSSRLAVVRTSASCTSERATGDAITRRFWVVPRPVAQWGNKRCCMRGTYHRTSPRTFKAFAVGAHKRQAARASARPGDAITRRFGFTTAGWPVGQLATSSGRVHGQVLKSISPSIVKAFAAGAHKRQAARASARPGDAITRRFWFCTTARFGPSGAISGVHRAHVGHLFFWAGRASFPQRKTGFYFLSRARPASGTRSLS
jgi:hypothetical protein